MLKEIRTVARVLTREEKRGALWLLAGIIAAASLEAVAVAAIMPFLNALFSAEPPLTGGVLTFLAPVYGLIGRRPRLVLGGVLIFLIVLANFVALAVTAAQLRFVYGVGHRLSTRLLRTYLALPYERLLRADISHLNKNVLDEGNQIVHGFLRPAAQVVNAMMTVVAVVGVLLLTAPVASIVVLVGLGALYGSFYLAFRRTTVERGARRADANRDRFRAVANAFGGLKDIKVAGSEPRFVERFDDASRKHARLLADFHLRQAVPRHVVDMLAFGGLVAIGFYFDATGGDIRPALPVIGLLVFATYRMVPAVQQLLGSVTQVQFHHATLEALADDLADEPSSSMRDHARPLPLARAVSIERVVVRHPGAARPALRGVSIQVPKGATVALVGRSGAGKSTLADVFLGLISPAEGVLRVDDAEIGDAQRSAWQANIGYVPQHIYLADDTIRNNIAFGLAPGDVDEGRLREAVRLAHLDELIESLPAGYETLVGERGVRLSGGQQQRIGIARALYRQPNVLVLDEATSDLDMATEAAITAALEGMRGRVTALVIAHRLATVQAADRIYLLEEGHVVAEGTYAELREREPRFQALARDRFATVEKEA